MDEDCENFAPVFFFLYFFLIFVWWADKRIDRYSRQRRLEYEQNPGLAMQPLWRRLFRRSQPPQLLREAVRPTRSRPSRTRNQDRTREYVINFSSSPVPAACPPPAGPHENHPQPGQQQPDSLRLGQLTLQLDRCSSELRQIRFSMSPATERFGQFHQRGEQSGPGQQPQQPSLLRLEQLTQQINMCLSELQKIRFDMFLPNQQSELCPSEQQSQQPNVFPSEQQPQQPDMFPSEQQPDVFPPEEQPQQPEFSNQPPPPYDTAIGFAPK